MHDRGSAFWPFFFALHGTQNEMTSITDSNPYRKSLRKSWKFLFFFARPTEKLTIFWLTPPLRVYPIMVSVEHSLLLVVLVFLKCCTTIFVINALIINHGIGRTQVISSIIGIFKVMYNNILDKHINNK